MTKNTTINACLTQTGIAPKSLTEANNSFNQKEKIMKNLRSFLIVSIVMFVALSGIASSTFGQELYQPPTTVELDQFRQDLDQTMQEIYQHRETLRQNKAVREALEKQSKTNSAPALALLRQQLREMNYEELAVMHKAYTTHFPEWREFPQALGKLVNKIGNPGKSDTPNAITPDNCQDAFNAQPSWTDWSIAQAIAIGADGLQNVIPPPFNGVATAVYVAAGETALAFETLNRIFERCQGDRDFENLENELIFQIWQSKSDIFADNFSQTNQLTNQISGVTLLTAGNIANSTVSILNNALINTANITTAVTSAESNIVNNANSNKTMIVNNDNTNKDTILTNLNTKTTTITGAVTSSQNAIIANADSNKTMLTTAITGSQNAVIANGDSNKTMLATAIANLQTSVNNSSTTGTTAITNAQTAIINNDNANKTMIVNNDNANALTLNTNLTSAKTMVIVNDNTNATNIVNNDNSNKTMIVNNDNANTTTLINNGNANTTAISDLILRSQIEADLATESNAVKVGWYLTPTANGGKLDLVQQIVTLTLANIQAAGGSTGNAQSFLTQANADKAAGNFKSAYDNYRKAYKAAVN